MAALLGLLLAPTAHARQPFTGSQYRLQRQNSWTLKNGVRVRQYRIMDKANHQVGYRRVTLGKNGRMTVVEQNLSKGIKKSTTKLWRGNNGTVFRARTIERTNGSVYKVRSASGKNGGKTRVASTGNGSTIRDKHWVAKNTRFKDRTVTSSTGHTTHSRTGSKATTVIRSKDNWIKWTKKKLRGIGSLKGVRVGENLRALWRSSAPPAGPKSAAPAAAAPASVD
jgi:hypothetical protein